MTSEETSVPLSKYVQRNSEKTNNKLHRRNRHKDGLDPMVNEPLVATPSQTKREDVLEDHHTCKRFNGYFAWVAISLV
jgi:hypothetical protein